MRAGWRVALAFGAIMLASSAMNNLFVTYYLHFFTHVAHLHPTAFYVGQSLFAVWNAVNDPLFGWLSDAAAAARSGGASPLQRRLPALRLGGTLWAAAFAFLWWPWGAPPADGDAAPAGSALLAGLHFTLAICAYDGMLTYVEVNHGAILAEATSDDAERARANAVAGIMAAVGSTSSFLGYLTYGDLPAFRVVALGVAVACVVVFELAARGLAAGGGELQLAGGASVARRGRLRGHPDDADDDGKAPRGAPATGSLGSFGAFLRTLASSRNFFVFVGISALQSFDCTLGKTFFVPFMNLLAPDARADANDTTVGVGARGVTIWLSFLVPHLLTVVWTPLIARRGLHFTLSAVFGLRLAALGVAAVATSAAYASAAPSPWLVLGVRGVTLGAGGGTLVLCVGAPSRHIHPIRPTEHACARRLGLRAMPAFAQGGGAQGSSPPPCAPPCASAPASPPPPWLTPHRLLPLLTRARSVHAPPPLSLSVHADQPRGVGVGVPPVPAGAVGPCGRAPHHGAHGQQQRWKEWEGGGGGLRATGRRCADPHGCHVHDARVERWSARAARGRGHSGCLRR
jgi:hypothetical protein